jgi:hypothetical protein
MPAFTFTLLCGNLSLLKLEVYVRDTLKGISYLQGKTYPFLFYPVGAGTHQYQRKLSALANTNKLNKNHFGIILTK